MRIKPILPLFLIALMVPGAARAQSNPCADKTCRIVFDWGNGGSAVPDVDRRFGAPSGLENIFAQTLNESGWKFVTGSAPASLTITVRLTPQNKALCETMPGVNPDYSCHTVQRAAIVFTANDSTQKSIGRVEVTPRCSDPKSYPSYTQFGRYAAEMVVYSVVNENKGQRPSAKCM
jgi:hypothetical protein